MSDDVKVPQVEEEASAAAEKDETATDVAKLMAELDEFKKRFNGLQSVLSKEQEAKKAIEQEAEAKKLESMSKLERIEHELEKERQERQRWQREAKMKENAAKAKDFLIEKKLPLSMLEMMDVSSDEALAASYEKANAIAEEVKASISAEYATKYGQTAPKTGQASGVTAPKSLAEAKTKEEKIAYLKAKKD